MLAMMDGKLYEKCLGDMSLLRHDGVIILKGLTAYKPVFDVTTLQTMSANELHQFSQRRNLFRLIFDKIFLAQFIADFVDRKDFIYLVGYLRPAS